MKEIVFVHLLNDYSGSPKVLSQVINIVQNNNCEVELYTGKSDDGFLTNVTKNHHFYFYKRFDNKFLTLGSFIVSQIDLFFKLLKYRNEDVLIYINTMLPFGGALAAKMINKPVCYHIHETSIQPKILKKILRYIIEITASRIIFVSNTLKKMESFSNIRQDVIYNTLPESFIKKAKKHEYSWKDSNGMFNVVMICSLKKYKGIEEFIQIAQLCKIEQDICFTLVLNAEKFEIDEYFDKNILPKNIQIYPKQVNLHSFYKSASLVMNLSRIDQWIETFGLTIIEAMNYGIPCIVPPVGGPAEIVEDKQEGYLISSYEIDKIVTIIKNLAENKEQCLKLSYNSKQKASKFNTKSFEDKILNIMND